MESYLPQIMKQKRINIYQLIELTGLSKETITRARDHRIQHCSLLTLKKIADALEVSTQDLYSN